MTEIQPPLAAWTTPKRRAYFNDIWDYVGLHVPLQHYETLGTVVRALVPDGKRINHIGEHYWFIHRDYLDVVVRNLDQAGGFLSIRYVVTDHHRGDYTKGVETKEWVKLIKRIHEVMGGRRFSHTELVKKFGTEISPDLLPIQLRWYWDRATKSTVGFSRVLCREMVMNTTNRNLDGLTLDIQYRISGQRWYKITKPE